ncbi:Zinc finger, PMZ-type [Sesbania bispinosa]|nr:Zinc finger, PMZ-type [Sesbania bispinosa]
MAMRNVIKRVFPNAHHRLCAWNLLCNATSNVGILDFISDLKRRSERCGPQHISEHALNYMRFKEEEDYFAFVLGEVLEKTSQIIVVGRRETTMCSIYTISKYQGGGREWYVSFYSPTIESTCTCQKMECYGLPCEHIMVVLVYLDAVEIPKSLILDRWTKIAKESIRGSFSDASYFWDSQLMARYVSLLELYKHGVQFNQENTEPQILDGNLQNPTNVRSKGCGTISSSGTTRDKCLNKCNVCGVAGHNKKFCPQQRPVNDVDPFICDNSMREVGEGSSLNNINLSIDPASCDSIIFMALWHGAVNSIGEYLYQ